MEKQRKFHSFAAIAGLLTALLFIVSCTQNNDQIIHGTIIQDAAAGDAVYVHLLDEDNPNIEYESLLHQTITVTGDVTSVEYSIDTSGIQSAFYYLLAGYDNNSPTNMDENDPDVWEAKAWYGGTVDGSGPHPPAAPNISDLNRRYDIDLVELP